jgi:quercetin dioxygenase-like cupin family protein
MTKPIRICVLGVLAAGLAWQAAQAQVQADAPTTAPAQKQVLLQADHSWNGVAYTSYPKGRPELTMLKLTIPPHTALPWHKHPVPNAGYILSGQLTIQDRQSGKSHTFHEGQAFAETVDDVHRGVSGDTPLVVLITYAGTPGTPTSIPVRGEKAEY